jgi:hypothetical protein
VLEGRVRKSGNRVRITAQIALLARAIAVDADFPLAWAALSRVHQTQAGFGFAPIDEGFDRAREAAQRALALAPDLAEAHIALGLVQQMHDWDWPRCASSCARRVLPQPPMPDNVSPGGLFHNV